MYLFRKGFDAIITLERFFGKQKRRVYDEKEGVRTVREALYSALSGNYVVPLRAKPKARTFHGEVGYAFERLRNVATGPTHGNAFESADFHNEQAGNVSSCCS